MKLELLVNLTLKATHTLAENESVHPHVWRIIVGVEGVPIEGRVISLPLAQSLFQGVLKELNGTHLNANSLLDAETRKLPTCENMAKYLHDRFLQVLSENLPDRHMRINFIEVGVQEEDGSEIGAARLSV